MARLLAQLPEIAHSPSELIERSRCLDTLYIRTRYPDSHPEGAPFKHCGPLQSAQAVEDARAIVEFVRPHLARSRHG